ncbi:hypothetical protein LENED_010713 [Lentinula edodes]|uniref:Uncharacterized protein n=1 Tax=Lentinula edodes TaxID=5353 RepID=A0A1Q3EN74_LENED|nr:hypothetical protein LENED_010713 [Lentinula edodes]
MGQYWTLINIDNRESSGHLGKLGEFFWGFNKIITYLLAPNIPTSYKLRTPMEKFQTNSGATLLTLPDELLPIIAEELVEDYLELMCFSLTCVAMWEVTEQVSIPLSLRQAEDVQLGWWSHYLLKLTKYRKKNLGTGLYDQRFQEPNSDISLLKDERVQSNATLGRELGEFSRNKPFSDWICLKWKDFMLVRTEGDYWMIRNFTKREFTKSNRRNLTQALYCLIGCSQDPSVSMPGGEDLINGKWAGHRIDITLASVHKQEYEDYSNWKDITPHIKEFLEWLAKAGGDRKFKFL